MAKVLSASRDAFGNIIVTACGNPDGHLDTDCPGDIGPLVYGKSHKYNEKTDKHGNALSADIEEEESDADQAKRVGREVLALAAHREKELTLPTPIKLGGKNG